MKISKGSIVARKSYGKDILFKIDRIIKLKNGERYCILKGLTVRIEADSPLSDIELVEEKRIINTEKVIEELMNKRIYDNNRNSKNYSIKTGKILHLDGDRKYSDKSARYYKKMGLNAIVKNIPENRQASMVRYLLEKYNPDILVITRA